MNETQSSPHPSMKQPGRWLALLLLGALASLLLLASQSDASAGKSRTASGTVQLPIIASPEAFATTPLGSGFSEVTAITHAGDGRLFIAERAGRVWIRQPDGSQSLFLDISDRVISGQGEYGFFDIDFHPQYASNGFFFVSYTTGFDFGDNKDVHTKVSRFRVSADPNVADPNTEAYLIREAQAFDVHKGGGMDFDPTTNNLYVGIGEDRGLLVAQEINSLKGKVVRLNPDAVPPDAIGNVQSFVDSQTWAMGLRNPWRIEVDAPGQQIYIGDVGDLLWEEINIAPLSVPYFNFGWPCQEGPDRIPGANDIPQCKTQFVPAVHEYPHRDGSGRCAVVGGHIYRPAWNPGDGRYIFGDMCTGEIFSLSLATGTWERTLLGTLPPGELLATIGEDAAGNLYAGTLSASGPVYQLTIR